MAASYCLFYLELEEEEKHLCCSFRNIASWDSFQSLLQFLDWLHIYKLSWTHFINWSCEQTTARFNRPAWLLHNSSCSIWLSGVLPPLAFEFQHQGPSVCNPHRLLRLLGLLLMLVVVPFPSSALEDQPAPSPCLIYHQSELQVV